MSPPAEPALPFMSASVYAVLRALAVQLRDRAAALDDHTLPPELQAVLDRCRGDLAVILAGLRRRATLRKRSTCVVPRA